MDFRLSPTTIRSPASFRSLDAKTNHALCFRTTPYNREGVVTGPVTDFGAYGTSVSDLSWDGILKDGTFIWMEFRTADRIFDEYDSGVKWYRVTNSQKKISSMQADDGELLRGRYCQLRAHLVVSPEGDASPLMKKVSMRYWVDMPPSVPF